MSNVIKNLKILVGIVIMLFTMPLMILGYILVVIGTAIKVIGYAFKLDIDSAIDEVMGLPGIITDLKFKIKL